MIQNAIDAGEEEASGSKQASQVLASGAPASATPVAATLAAAGPPPAAAAAGAPAAAAPAAGAPAAAAPAATAPLPPMITKKDDNNTFANWWEIPDQVDAVAKAKDDTPQWIQDHPDYKKMVDTFLPATIKDKNLQAFNKKNHVSNDDVDETKEWEGMYPNKMDQEMQGYEYGDKLKPSWYGWGNGGTNNYDNYYVHQGTLAPPFDPNSHFESPYYDYGDRAFPAWN